MIVIKALCNYTLNFKILLTFLKVASDHLVILLK